MCPSLQRSYFFTLGELWEEGTGLDVPSAIAGTKLLCFISQPLLSVRARREKNPPDPHTLVFRGPWWESGMFGGQRFAQTTEAGA